MSVSSQQALLGSWGVGDLENNGSEFPMQTPRSCSPKTFQYDYAEYPTHQYEELPNKSRTFTREDFHSNHLSNLSSDIPYEDDSPAHSQAHEIEMTRKRFNPLYEAVTKAIPDKTAPPQRTVEATYKQLKCLQTWFIIFVVFVFVCLFTILFITLFYNPSDAALVKKFRNLESKYESLESKYQSLVAFWATSGTNDSSIVLTGLSHRVNSLENETINLNRALNLSMNSLEISLDASLQNVSKFALNVSNELHKTQSVLEEKMLNLSKMPGPMGPPGSVDLTKCQFRNVTDYSNDEVTSTIWIPSDPIYKDYIAIGGSCSTRGGQSTQLVKKNHQFRCLCYGQQQQKYSVKVCTIHLWLCPQTNY